MQRLARNIGGYKGETIDIQRVLGETARLANETGWTGQPLSVSETVTLPAYHKPSANGQKHIYISAGIHGDEPASPLAILKLFQENKWPAHLTVWIVPCLNPGGFGLNRREDEQGIDLNRDYRAFRSPLVRAHATWLEAR